MDTVPPARERRRLRSSDPLVALSLMLESARREGALEILVMADLSGCVVAGAGAAWACDELAAQAAIAHDPPANDTIPSRLEVMGRPGRIARIRIDGIEMLLASRGNDRPGSLSRAAAGARRILSTRRR